MSVVETWTRPGLARFNFLHIEGQPVTLLQVESNIGPLIAKALSESPQAQESHWKDAALSCDTNLLHIVTTDEFAGNHAAERILSEHE